MAELATIEATEVAAQHQSTAVTPMDLLTVAMDKGADLDRLEKLMAMQERWEANQARKDFVAAMSAFKANPPEVLKNKRVAFNNTRYSHASLDHVVEVIGKAMSEHNLSHRWDVEQKDNQVTVTCIVEHVNGHSEKTSLRSGMEESGTKNKIQALGSAITYLQRYTLLAAVGLATKDQDSDGNGFGGAGGCINEIQKETLINLIRETDTDTKAFTSFLKVNNIDELPVSKYEMAVRALNKKKANNNADS